MEAAAVAQAAEAAEAAMTIVFPNIVQFQTNWMVVVVDGRLLLFSLLRLGRLGCRRRFFLLAFTVFSRFVAFSTLPFAALTIRLFNVDVYSRGP